MKNSVAAVGAREGAGHSTRRAFNVPCGGVAQDCRAGGAFGGEFDGGGAVQNWPGLPPRFGEARQEAGWVGSDWLLISCSVWPVPSAWAGHGAMSS